MGSALSTWNVMAWTHQDFQIYWWFLVSVLGSTLVSLLFVQGGQTYLWTFRQSELEVARTLILNVLGKKWELGFTTLVTFGGALFAAFPLIYSTAFGGGYFFWLLLLFFFIIQAVSYEYRNKVGNFLGSRVFECFLVLNGFFGTLLLGVAVGAFFSGSPFLLSPFNMVSWEGPLRGLESLASVLNLSLGFLVFFLARITGSQYLRMTIVDPHLGGGGLGSGVSKFSSLLFRSQVFNVGGLLTALVIFLISTGPVAENWLTLKWKIGGILLLAVVFIVFSLVATWILGWKRGFWIGFSGVWLAAFSLFWTLGYNASSVYPSSVDPVGSSITLQRASSSLYTLQVMSGVSLAIPFILAYIVQAWRNLSRKPLSTEDLGAEVNTY